MLLVFAVLFVFQACGSSGAVDNSPQDVNNSSPRWDFDQEAWSLLARDEDYKIFFPKKVSCSDYSIISQEAEPFLEYRRTLLKAQAGDGTTYVAVLIDFYMNPYNKKDEYDIKKYKCRSKYLTVTTYMDDATVGETHIDYNDAGNHKGKYELSIIASKVLDEKTKNPKGLKINYLYYKPARNDSYYLISMTPLKYLAIYRLDKGQTIITSLGLI